MEDPHAMTDAEIVAEYLRREAAAKATPQGHDVVAICAALGREVGMNADDVLSLVIEHTISGAN